MQVHSWYDLVVLDALYAPVLLPYLFLQVESDCLSVPDLHDASQHDWNLPLDWFLIIIK